MIQNPGTRVDRQDAKLLRSAPGAFRQGYDEAGQEASRTAELAAAVRFELFRNRAAAHVTRDALAGIEDRLVAAQAGDADGDVFRHLYDRRRTEQFALAKLEALIADLVTRLHDEFGEEHSTDY